MFANDLIEGTFQSFQTFLKNISNCNLTNYGKGWKNENLRSVNNFPLAYNFCVILIISKYITITIFMGLSAQEKMQM